MPLLEIKTAKITEKGQIAIPKEIRKIEGFKTDFKGDVPHENAEHFQESWKPSQIVCWFP